jgi:hypothetical protein
MSYGRTCITEIATVELSGLFEGAFSRRGSGSAYQSATSTLRQWHLSICHQCGLILPHNNNLHLYNALFFCYKVNWILTHVTVFINRGILNL